MKIILDNKEVEIYLCDQKDKCNRSKYCGNRCIFTFDKKHESEETKKLNAKEEQAFLEYILNARRKQCNL